MREPMLETIEPYEAHAEEGYEWDPEDDRYEEREPMNVLWGRVALLGVVVLFAFLFGRALGTGGIPESQLVAAQDEIRALTEENDALKAELAAQTEIALPPESEINEQGPTEAAPSEGESAPTEVAGRTYKVRSGDSLSKIAKRFYGDAGLASFLADVNDIEDAATISIGQKILIPHEPPKA